MKKDNNTRNALIILALLLLGLNIYQFLRANNLSKSLTESQENFSELSLQKEDLQKSYDEAIMSLNNMRGENDSLNLVIDKQIEDIRKKKSQINNLLADSRNLAKAKEEIEVFKSQIAGYIQEVSGLKNQVGALTSQNRTLSSENENLSTALTEEKSVREELEVQKENLISERENLTAKNEDLSTKVTFGSVLRPASLELEGVKIRNSGKEGSRRRAKAVNEIKVCFNTGTNELAAPGRETYYLRVINPLGETEMSEQSGGGTMSLASSGQKIRYSKSVQFDYNGEPRDICMNYEPISGVVAGEYNVELYNKGYLAGKSSIVFK